MTAAERPWWASDGAFDDDVDPVEAHRRARRDAGPGGGVRDGSGHGSAGGQEGGGSSSSDRGDGGGAPGDDGSWWVPAADAVTRLVRDLTASATASPPEDLAERLRDVAAVAGDGAPGDGVPTGGAGEGGSAPGSEGRDGGEGPGGHRIDACGVCPICVGLRALGDARPDLVVHLAEATRHLALAVRTVVDAATDGRDPAGRGPGAPGRRAAQRDGLEHIDLDAD
ncbi:MAG: hypothetical protein WEB09_10345 [Nitriliruptor sp.]